MNLLSDSTAALTLFAMLLRNTEGRTALFSTCGRVISGLSDTAKAFLIIAGACLGVCVPGQGCSLVHASSLHCSTVSLAGTDILLGYHSEEGWTAAIHLITGHYGYEVEVRMQCLLLRACWHNRRHVGLHAMAGCAGRAHLRLCCNRARDDGCFLQTVDFPGPESPEPSVGGDTEEHGPPLGSVRVCKWCGNTSEHCYCCLSIQRAPEQRSACVV